MLERILMAAHRGLAGCSAVAGAEAGSALGKDTSREGGSRQGSEAAGRGDVASSAGQLGAGVRVMCCGAFSGAERQNQAPGNQCGQLPSARSGAGARCE